MSSGDIDDMSLVDMKKEYAAYQQIWLKSDACAVLRNQVFSNGMPQGELYAYSWLTTTIN
jgi:hypothetical protein